MRSLITAITLTMASGLAMAEPAALLRDSELRANPRNDAALVQTLKGKAVVDITSRQGAWAQVKTTDGKTGWVRVLNLRTGSGQKGEAGLGTLASVFKTGSSGNTVSTGVKGLSEEKLKTAQPNEEEAKRLDRQKTTDSDARQYARQGKLGSQQVNYLPEGKE